MITEDDLVEAVREQARMHPDRVYQVNDLNAWRCTYLPNKANPDCGCIVGEALVWLGIPSNVMQQINTVGGWTGLDSESTMSRVLGHLVTPAALGSSWVAYVQCHQDDGCTWSEAVAKADAEAEGNA